MTAKVLVTGRGKSGSWRIRGYQLGQAIGATVYPKAYRDMFTTADLVVLVKRQYQGFLDHVRQSGKPWVWDIVDPYPQPESNYWSSEECIKWLQEEVQIMRPNAMVFPTYQMLADSGFTGPSLVLPHHSWPKYYTPNLVRKIKILGYEGGEQYLGTWRTQLEAECVDRGIQLVINGDMTQVDVGIALRDPLGYAAKSWKSNVKIANLHALGLSIICTQEQSYKDFGGGGEIIISAPEQLTVALDSLYNYEFRQELINQGLRARITLDNVAETYSTWLTQLKF